MVIRWHEASIEDAPHLVIEWTETRPQAFAPGGEWGPFKRAMTGN